MSNRFVITKNGSCLCEGNTFQKYTFYWWGCNIPKGIMVFQSINEAKEHIQSNNLKRASIREYVDCRIIGKRAA